MNRALFSSIANKAVRVLFLPLLCCSPILGCTERQPTRVPVAGKVLIDGKPLAFGTIRFVPEHGRPASSVLMSDGTFDLASTTLVNNSSNIGVVPGKYRIEVSASEVVDEETLRWHAPKKYASFRRSRLEETIQGAVYDLLIELTWDGVEGPVLETQSEEIVADETSNNEGTEKEENGAPGTDTNANE